MCQEKKKQNVSLVAMWLQLKAEKFLVQRDDSIIFLLADKRGKTVVMDRFDH